jgi:membrane associated rhomboid family serine protease
MPDRIGRWGPRYPKEVTPEFRETLASRTPHIWVTPALLWANSLVHAAMAIGGADPWSTSSTDAIKWGANYGHLTLGGQWWRLLTSAFVHFGTPHLVLNMVVLWSVGYLVEALIGNVGFLVTYMLAAVLGSIASLAWNPYAVAAGASGAVFGVYGILLAYLVRARESVPKELVRRLVRGAGLFVLLNLALGLAIKNIDVADHLGGLVAGFGGGLLFARPLDKRGSSLDAGLRALALGLLGSFAVVATVKLSLTPIDLTKEMAEVRDVQGTVRSRYVGALIHHSAKTMTDGEFSRFLDNDMRPLLRKHVDRLKSLQRLRGTQKDRVRNMSTNLDLVEHSFALLSEAVRNQDVQTFENAKELMDKANAIAAANMGSD